MISEEKRKHIKKQLSRGEPEGEIKNVLRGEGYSEEEINALFFDLSSKQTSSAKSNQNGNGKVFSLIGACLLITGIAMLGIPTWLSEYAVPIIVLGAISICVQYFITNRNK